MSEDKLRAALAHGFGMTPDAITRSVEQARQHLGERTTDAPFVFASGPHEEHTVTFVERRNHASRAARVQRLIDVIGAATDGIRVTDLVEDLTPAAAERILKPLAVRGLVKVTEGRWAPRDCFRAGLNLPLIPE